MKLARAAVFVLVFASSAARAWEPASPAAVQARIEELRKAWSGKSDEEIVADKLERAHQPRPAWVSKVAWKLELPPLTFYFAVGKSGRAEAAAPAGARATASAPAAPGDAPAAPAGAPPLSAAAAPPQSAVHPLDFWLDEAQGALYTLVVDAR